jgi:hypothetical protein
MAPLFRRGRQAVKHDALDLGYYQLDTIQRGS